MTQKIKLKELVDIHSGKAIKASENGTIPILAIGSVQGYTDRAITNEPIIAIGSQGSIGHPRFINFPCWITTSQIYLTAKKDVDLRYIFSILDNINFKRYKRAYAIRDCLEVEIFANMFITVPVLPEQKRIAESYFVLLEEIKHEKETINKLKHVKDVMLSGMFPKSESKVFKYDKLN